MTSNNKVDLTNIGLSSDIPSSFYGATNYLIGKVDPFAGKLMSRAILPGGTAIAMTINLIKDPDNKGKVIASTILSTGVMYTVGGPFIEKIIVRLIMGIVATTIGVGTAPIAITIATAVGITVVGTVAGSFLYDIIFKQLETFEEFTDDLEIEIFAAEIRGTITKKEFILNELTNDQNFCKNIFPKYDRYRQIVTIGTSEGYGNTLMSYIKNDSKKNVGEVKVKNLDEAKIATNLLLNANNKLRKKTTTVYTTDDNQKYQVMLKQTIEKIAKKNKVSYKELLDHNEWVKNENRIK